MVLDSPKTTHQGVIRTEVSGLLQILLISGRRKNTELTLNNLSRNNWNRRPSPVSLWKWLLHLEDYIIQGERWTAGGPHFAAYGSRGDWPPTCQLWVARRGAQGPCRKANLAITKEDSLRHSGINGPMDGEREALQELTKLNSWEEFLQRRHSIDLLFWRLHPRETASMNRTSDYTEYQLCLWSRDTPSAAC